MGTVRIEEAGHTATVWLENPGKRNAISRSMTVAMHRAFDTLGRRSELRCIVLRGAGTEAFASGADISEFAVARANVEQAQAFARQGHAMMHAVRDCPIPVVAGIRGACIGGGLEIAALCDLRIAADDARFGVPIGRLGAVLAYPELAALLRVASPTTALEILLEGRIMNAQEALAKQLVNRVVPSAHFEAELQATVDRICALAPLSARWHKRFVAKLRSGTQLSAEDLAEGTACYDTEDYRIGYESFLAKDPPVFVGR